MKRRQKLYSGQPDTDIDRDVDKTDALYSIAESLEQIVIILKRAFPEPPHIGNHVKQDCKTQE